MPLAIKAALGDLLLPALLLLPVLTPPPLPLAKLFSHARLRLTPPGAFLGEEGGGTKEPTRMTGLRLTDLDR